MFPFPQNTLWGSPQSKPAAGSGFTAFSGHQAPKASPRVTKNQSQRLALAERMCDLDIRMAHIWSWGPGQVDEIPLAARLQIGPHAIPGTMGGGDALWTLQEFFKRAVAPAVAGKPAFRETARGWQPTAFGMQLLPMLGILERLAARVAEDTRYDPYLQLGLEAFRHVGLHHGAGYLGGPVSHIPGWLFQGYAQPLVANLCNAFVHECRLQGGRIAMGRSLQVHQDLHRRRTSELRAYFDNLLKRHPNCRLEQFELCMWHSSTANARDEYRSMVEASSRLLREIGREFGSVIVGDVRKIDRGMHSPYLVHVKLAVDGPSAQEFTLIQQALKDGWVRQAPQNAYFVDCNTVQDFMYRGTARQGEHETLASQLDNAAMFLAGTDCLLHVGYGGTHDGLIIGTTAGKSLA